MLTKKQMDMYADVLLWGLKKARTETFKKGDVVMVQFDFPAVELAEFLHGKLLDMGVHVVMRSGKTTVMEHDFYEKSDEKQLVFRGSWDEELFKNLNGRIFLHGPTSLTHLADIDPGESARWPSP